MGSPFEDDSPSEGGPASGGVGSVRLMNGFSGVGPAYGFSRYPLTFCGRVSPASIPSVNVPFSAATIQYGPVHRNRSFPGIFPIRVWNTSTALPISNSSSFLPRWRSTNAFRHNCSSSSAAMLITLVSPKARSCCKRSCWDSSSDSPSRTWICKLGIWNSTGITAFKPNASRNGVA